MNRDWLTQAPTAAVVVVTVVLIIGIAAAHLYTDNSVHRVRASHGFLYLGFAVVTVIFGSFAANGGHVNRVVLGFGAFVFMILAIVALCFGGYHLVRKAEYDIAFAYANLVLANAMVYLAARSFQYSPAGDNGGDVGFNNLARVLNGTLVALFTALAVAVAYVILVKAVKYARNQLK